MNLKCTEHIRSILRLAITLAKRLTSTNQHYRESQRPLTDINSRAMEKDLISARHEVPFERLFSRAFIARLSN